MKTGRMTARNKLQLWTVSTYLCMIRTRPGLTTKRLPCAWAIYIELPCVAAHLEPLAI